MKKNIIRLTEAELKQYIGKVIAEQQVSQGPMVDRVVGVKNATQGKNVQLYLDANKSKAGHLVNIKSVGHSKDGLKIWFFVKDLSFVNATGGDAVPQDGGKAITHLSFDCTEPDMLFAQSNGLSVGPVFCPAFTAVVKETAGCKMMNLKPDFAKVKPMSPEAEAPKPDFA